MANFSFDAVSDYDKAEMNNVFDQTQREMSNRYDFKGTPAAIEWLNGDKTGLKITGSGDWQIDAILDIVRKKLAALGQRLKSMRTLGAAQMQTYVRQHVQGHLQYFGVSGNSRCMQSYVYQVKRLLFKWLNRRSQRRSFNWARYDQWLSTWMPRPRIVHTL